VRAFLVRAGMIRYPARQGRNPRLDTLRDDAPARASGFGSRDCSKGGAMITARGLVGAGLGRVVTCVYLTMEVAGHGLRGSTRPAPYSGTTTRSRTSQALGSTRAFYHTSSWRDCDRYRYCSSCGEYRLRGAALRYFAGVRITHASAAVVLVASSHGQGRAARLQGTVPIDRGRPFGVCGPCTH